jgi:hypothetical protein
MKHCECQKGKGGLTSIKNVEREEMITYRPFPVNRLNNNVGPYVRDSNFRNMDINQTLSRDSKFFFRQNPADTPRLGQSLPSLPDRRQPSMRGGAQSSLTGVQTSPQLDSAGSGLKQTVKKVGKAIGKTAKKVGKTAVKVGKFIKDKKLISKGADIGAKIAGVLGQEELVAPLEGVSQTAKMFGFGAGQYARAQQELHGTSAMPAGIDKQSFVPTHPLNFNRARINKI